MLDYSYATILSMRSLTAANQRSEVYTKLNRKILIYLADGNITASIDAIPSLQVSQVLYFAREHVKKKENLVIYVTFIASLKSFNRVEILK